MTTMEGRTKDPLTGHMSMLPIAIDGAGALLTTQSNSTPQRSLSATAVGANAVSAVQPAVPGLRYRVTGLNVSFSGTPTGGGVSILQGGVAIYSVIVTAGGFTDIPVSLTLDTNTSLSVSFTNSAAGVTGIVNLTYQLL